MEKALRFPKSPEHNQYTLGLQPKPLSKSSLCYPNATHARIQPARTHRRNSLILEGRKFLLPSSL